MRITETARDAPTKVLIEVYLMFLLYLHLEPFRAKSKHEGKRTFVPRFEKV